MGCKSSKTIIDNKLMISKLKKESHYRLNIIDQENHKKEIKINQKNDLNFEEEKKEKEEKAKDEKEEENEEENEIPERKKPPKLNKEFKELD